MKLTSRVIAALADAGIKRADSLNVNEQGQRIDVFLVNPSCECRLEEEGLGKGIALALEREFGRRCAVEEARLRVHGYLPDGERISVGWVDQELRG